MPPRVVRPLIGRCHALGHAVIDLDHAAIGDWWIRVVGCEQVEFPFFLARLKMLLRSHFDHEGALMREAGGLLCPHHRREHQMLLDLCDEAAGEAERDWRRAQALLRSRFAKLIREHILSMDQCAVMFLNTHEQACQA